MDLVRNWNLLTLTVSSPACVVNSSPSTARKSPRSISLSVLNSSLRSFFWKKSCILADSSFRSAKMELPCGRQANILPATDTLDFLDFLACLMGILGKSRADG